jgi:hypothetical protein
LVSRILPPITAAIYPERFVDNLILSRNRIVMLALIGLVVIVAFGLRVSHLSAESLSEDEFNKLKAVAEYRELGLSGVNGEHPFLMKGLQTLSIYASESVNELSGARLVEEEAALRFPIVLFGTGCVVLLFMFGRDLFGASTGLAASGLWAVEPLTVGFDRVAKEDTLVLFFFLLTLLFWLRAQASAERGEGRMPAYLIASGVSFAALMASKYYPFLLGIPVAYYGIFARVPGNKWVLRRKDYVPFFLVMAAAFLVFNPTIFLPETWREMLNFMTQQRVGHDSFEFMGELYPHKLTDWLYGVPWYFYLVLAATKLSLPTLLLGVAGLPLLLRRNLGDGRFLLFFWLLLFVFPFSIAGGKFSRYFTLMAPLTLISAATAFCFLSRHLTRTFFMNGRVTAVFQIALFLAVITVPLVNSVTASAHFRLFTNVIGGGKANAGTYFPHDEFYDAGTRDVLAEIGANAQYGATVASETSELFAHYARRISRPDLVFVSLSERNRVCGMKPGDLIVLVKGRRYNSNAAYHQSLAQKAATVIQVGEKPAAAIYALDASTLEEFRCEDAATD